MNRLILAATAVFAVSGTAALAADMPFIAKAAQGDLAEVSMGKLAEKKGSTPAVRAYGKMLVTDHGAHHVKAVALARKLHVTPPATPSDEQKQMYTEVSAKSGTDFDAAFKAMMIDDHNKDIADYTEQAKSGKGAVVPFAKATLPTLQKHLDAAQAL